MTDYEWLTSMNLCHRCMKNRTAPGKKFCFDCQDKYREYNAKHYDPEYAKEYQQRRREIYREKKAAGICIRCNKQATHGLYCYEHSIVERRKSKYRAEKQKNARHDRGLIPEYRIKNGLCFVCGTKIEDDNLKRGCKVCKRHSDFFSECAKRNETPWKEDNKLVFRKSTNR